MDGTLGALVIADGGIAGLLACAAAVDGRLGSSDNLSRARIGVWVPLLDPANHGRRAAAAAAQAGLYGFRIDLGSKSASPPPSSAAACHEDESLALMLLEAAFLARASGASTVIWPATAGPEGSGGPDLERVAGIVDRALLVSRLASLGAESPVEIRTPYADITDPGLADLVLDMDLPIWTCWWAHGDTDQAAAAEHEYWAGLLKAAGWLGEWPGPADAPIVSNAPRARATFQEKGP